MSDNNGWPDPTRPGVPPSEGFWWLLLPLDVEAIRYFDGEIWRIGGQLADPKDFAKYTLIGPCLTPAEVDARIAQARRDALKEAALVAEERYNLWHMPHPDDARPFEVCDDASACRDIAAAIRALADKE